MKRRQWISVMLLLAVAGLSAVRAEAQAAPPAEQTYQDYFVHYVDHRSYVERILNAIGLTNNDVGRSFALLAGVSKYLNMPRGQRTLQPAAEDLRKLQAYLQEVEFFDEIVVLKNKDMTLDNLTYFLQGYFPERLRQFPKSRFLFAYSGHGVNEAGHGYLLQYNASAFDDFGRSIDLESLRSQFYRIIHFGHHVLVLINACHSGSFLKRGFGEHRFVPKHPGAHAITAGGSNEIAWHDPNVGAGSVFFEKFLAGLNGQADGFPPGGDGVVTVNELAAYLRQEVQISTEHHQNPQAGDISPDGSRGGFFLLNRGRMVDENLMQPWPPQNGQPYGGVVEPDAQVAELLEQADVYFARQWYTTPPDANAFDVYCQVLRLDPTNAHAHQKLDAMAAFYRRRAEVEEQRGRIQEALEWYGKYLKVRPNDEAILDKVAELETPAAPTPVPTRPPEPTPTAAPTRTPVPPTPTPGIAREWSDPTTGMEFVWIESGCFQMGQTEAEKQQLIADVGQEKYDKYYDDEVPVHEVCVDGLYMGKYEVTNAQYRQWKREHDSGDYQDHSLNNDAQPAVEVSWEEAVEFADWLTEQSDGNAAFRLPTEAEWEYAARAGTTTARFWGDDPDKACAYANVHDDTSDQAFDWDWSPHDCDDGYAVSAPVGSFRPNAFGLYDMLGNVWEWCADTYHDSYADAPADGSFRGSLGDEKTKVLRGGSWLFYPRSVRSAFRGRGDPGGWDVDFGFRVVVGSAPRTLE